MRSEGQPPADRIMRGFLFCLAMIASARQRPKPGATFAEAVADSSSRDHELATRWLVVVPTPKSWTGEEAATPGQPVALKRVSGCFPLRQFAYAIRRCHWLCRNHPACPRTLTFRWTHFPLLCCGPQYKKQGGLCRTCGGWDFFVEGFGKL